MEGILKKFYVLAIAIATVFCVSFSTSKAIGPSLAMGGELSYNHPLQDFGEYLAKSGIGISVLGEANILAGISAYARLGYVVWMPLDEYSWEGDFVNAELKVSEIPIAVGAKYVLPMPGFQPYAGLELGIRMFRLKLDYEGQLFGMNVSEAESYREVGVAPMVGLKLPAGENMKIDACLKYNYVTTSNLNEYEMWTGDNLKISYVTVGVGVLYTLGL